MQFSDAPNETDVALIMRSCDAAANLLQPSKPLTAVDSTHDTGGGAVPGFALTTHTAVGGAVWMRFLLTHQLSKPFAVRGLDFWPALDVGATFATTTFAALQACGAAGGGACGVTTFAGPADPHTTLATLPPVADGVDKFTPTLTLVVPLQASGVALFGEVDKFAAISVQRFTALSATAAGVTATLAGIAGESIRVAWWATSKVVFANTTFAAGGGPKTHVSKSCSFNADGTSSCSS